MFGSLVWAVGPCLFRISSSSTGNLYTPVLTVVVASRKAIGTDTGRGGGCMGFHWQDARKPAQAEL
eukprot:2886995-Rhodomonas_salina.3